MWEGYVNTDEVSYSGDFVIVELNAKSVRLLKEKGVIPFRRLGTEHYIYKDSDELNPFLTWSANHKWKLGIHNESEAIGKYLIKTLQRPNELELGEVKILSSYPKRNILIIQATHQEIESLLKNPNVVHISDEHLIPKVESRVIDMNLNPNRINKIHRFFPDLEGSGETVSIKENRFNKFDIDLLGRTLETGLESEVLDNHADEMTTIIAGAGNSFITGKGVAYNSAVTSSDFINVLPDQDDYYQSQKVKIQNHSYGTELEAFYGIQAQAFDQSAVNNPSLLHVFSSGNQGMSVGNQGKYAEIDGFANLTGNFKMSKNTLVVGSVDTVGREVSFVSRGPAYDGRVKPELVAYSSVGSSNSAALVSGISTLLQQQYGNMNGSDMPSSLVKALLINSAEDVGLPGLDFVTGYGSVNAFKSLQSLQNNQFFSGSVSQGIINTHLLNIPDNALNLKITLVWTDPAANSGDAIALVNDLDLRLNDGAMNVTLPWVLDHSANATSLSAAANRGVDRLNNVEQITIANPETNYSIEVEGFLVSETQDYYLAYQYEVADSFEWDYPTANDNMPYNGESGSYFRWNTTIVGMGQLYYSIDGGKSWVLLDDEVDLKKGYRRWSTIPTINDEAIARMIIEGQEFDTEVFSISRPFKPKVGFNCSDSAMLRWPVVPSATNYSVLNMGSSVLEEVTTTSDTFLILPNKSTFADNRFSIRPNLGSGKSLVQTPAFDYALQGVECYVFSFFPQIVLDTGIYLNLMLGTSYGVKSVDFYRFDGRERVVISAISDVTTDLISILDESPNQGYNEHSVVIEFQNGEILEMSAGSSFYLTEIPIKVFPNPIFNTDELSVLTKELDSETPVFKLFDMKGREVLSLDLLSTQNNTPIDNLNPGVYLYRLQDGDKLYSGRILVK